MKRKLRDLENKKMRKKSKLDKILSLYKQMMDLHVKIAPESYMMEKNYKKIVVDKLSDRWLYEHRVNNKLIGMAMYYVRDTPNKIKTCFITDFVIDKPKRGKGHGKAMLKELHTIAEKMGCKQIHLLVAFKNLPAKMLYESFGYQPTTVRMYKELSCPPKQ